MDVGSQAGGHPACLQRRSTSLPLIFVHQTNSRQHQAVRRDDKQKQRQSKETRRENHSWEKRPFAPSAAWLVCAGVCTCVCVWGRNVLEARLLGFTINIFGVCACVQCCLYFLKRSGMFCNPGSGFRHDFPSLAPLLPGRLRADVGHGDRRAGRMQDPHHGQRPGHA